MIKEFKKILKKVNKLLFLVNFQSRKVQIGLVLALIVGVLLPLRVAYAFPIFGSILAGVAIFAILKPGFIIGLVSYIFYALKYPAETLLDLGANILNTVMTEFFNRGLFRAPFVRQAWGLTRDVANMFFILWLVIIAVATILDIRGWQAKKLLPKLIIIALLVNFSLVIGWFLLDLGNAALGFFAKVDCRDIKGEIASGPDCLRYALHQEDFFAIHKPSFIDLVRKGASEAAVQLSDNVLGVVLLGGAGIAFFMLAVMMLTRMVALWFLLIVAPLAWVFGIMPFGAKWLRRWWSEFFKWAFYGVVVAFFLYIGVNIVVAIESGTGWGARFSAAQAPGTSVRTNLSFFDSLAHVMKYLTIVIFVILALKLGRDTAAGAGDFVTTTVAKTGQRWGRKAGRVATYPARRGWQRTQIGAARTAEQGLKRIEGVPVVGAAAGRARTGISQWRGKREAKYYKRERRRISNLTRDEIMGLAKDGNIEARRIAALRHWTKNKAELPDSEARDWYTSLSPYPEVQETLAEDRPSAAGEEVPPPEIQYFDVNVNGGDWGHEVELTPGDVLGMRWEVLDKYGGERVHRVDINVSGDNRKVPGVVKLENQARENEITPPKGSILEYNFALDEPKTVYYQLVAKNRRGGVDTASCTVRFAI